MPRLFLISLLAFFFCSFYGLAQTDEGQPIPIDGAMVLQEERTLLVGDTFIEILTDETRLDQLAVRPVTAYTFVVRNVSTSTQTLRLNRVGLSANPFSRIPTGENSASLESDREGLLAIDKLTLEPGETVVVKALIPTDQVGVWELDSGGASTIISVG